MHISEKETPINKAVYVSMDDLRQNLSRPEVPDEAEDTYKALMNGQRVYTEIIYLAPPVRLLLWHCRARTEKRRGDRNYPPTTPASELVQTESLSMLPLPDNQFIVDSDGTVLFQLWQPDLTGSSLFDFLGGRVFTNSPGEHETEAGHAGEIHSHRVCRRIFCDKQPLFCPPLEPGSVCIERQYAADL